ncbi:hypothetical protein FOA43_001935 [Brettanomyces nanus]|uniref:PEX18/PEX21 C-terminal domain-containing protein n=1 Tax=Eeniella nana TaxID=13502 RepID=A0A875S113_EENNA|nr:uncharacterized protein FOA43_001935 [Brettanomyces nanus]QPG74603.1 hypothetical protein FOA43_001935 [Brettanomyces nanus]
MSFLQTDPASCAGNSAINKFNSRANMDSSINHQLQSNGRQQLQRPDFNKLHRIDAGLQNEFRDFGTQGSFQEYRQPSQMQQGSLQQLPQRGWVNDFQKMTISESQDQRMNQMDQQRDQHDQHNQMDQHNRQIYQHNQQMNQANQRSQQANVQQWSMEFNSLEQRQVRAQNSDSFQTAATKIKAEVSPVGFTRSYGYSNAPYTLQSGLQDSSTDSEAKIDFDSAFNNIEKQLSEHGNNIRVNNSEMNVKEKTMGPIGEVDKIKFAQLAQSVFNTMNSASPKNASNEMNEKFKQSKFMNLMDRISKREVEINDKKDKFVDSQGHDIRDDLPDPLKDLRDTDLRDLGPYDSAKAVHEKLGKDLSSTAWETTF